MGLRKWVCCVFAGLLALGSVNVAHAWSFSVAEFFIDDDADPTDVGSTDLSGIFADAFDDGNFFTNPGSTIGYTHVQGVPVEGGGLVTFDAYQGAFGISDLSGDPRLLSRARVDTALASGSVFSAVGVFGLATPDPRGRYGVRLNDGGSGAGADRVEMVLQRTQSGNLRLSFRYADWGSGANAVIAQHAFNPPAGTEWLAMALIKGDTSLDAITAGYAFLDIDEAIIGGTPTYFGTTHDIFNTETFTRAEMFGVQVVPEMETWAMMLAGMGSSATGCGGAGPEGV